MQDKPKRNDDVYVREGGPYADLLRELVESGRYGSAAEVVLEEMDCQPCHGYFCEKFDEPECIKRVPVERVNAAIERVLRASGSNRDASC